MSNPIGDWPAYYPGSINYDARADFDRNFIINDLDTAIIGEYLSQFQVPADCEEKLNLLSPAGDLYSGSVHTIQWQWNIYTDYTPFPGDEDNPSGPFELSYSDGNGNWTVIDTVTGTPSYNWTVPDANSQNCMLHIDDLSHSGLTDSAGPFTILPWTGPVIGVDSNDIYFAAPEGLDPEDLLLSIYNDGGDVLNWEVTENCPWLEVYPDNGSCSDEIGTGDGTGYCVNMPLPIGTYDQAYMQAFNDIARPLIGAYSPDVIVFELGADALSGDPLAHLQLTNNAYADIIYDVLDFNKPILMTGGGGYNIENTARAWALAWSILCGADAENRDVNIGMGGVMLESTDWHGGLRDRQLPADNQRCEAINQAINATIEIVKTSIFPFYGI